MVTTVQDVVDVPLSFDTTNLAAIEAGLKLAKRQAMINSTSAEPERLERVPPVAAEYNAKLIALMMGKSGIPMTAEERVSIAIDQLVPGRWKWASPWRTSTSIPLVLTVAGCQEYAPHAVEAIRYIKQGMDPAPLTTCGLSNVSNHCAAENRSLLNRIYLVMLMAAGLDTAIADPLDDKLMEVIRIVEQRETARRLRALCS